MKIGRRHAKIQKTITMIQSDEAINAEEKSECIVQLADIIENFQPKVQQNTKDSEISNVY